MNDPISDYKIYLWIGSLKFDGLKWEIEDIFIKRRRTKSGKKRFFIKKQNKVSNLDDQFEEVVFLHQKKEEEIGEES